MEYDSDDEEYEHSQKRQEELRRQKAESAPLRPRNYDPFSKICNQWSQDKVSPHPSKRLALTELNEYDSDSASDSLAPTGTSLASSVVIPSLSPISPASSLMHDLEMEAWELLNSYFTSDSDKGGEVHAALEKLGVGSEWENMWGRITALEPGDADAGQSVREALDAMKPPDARLSGAPTSVSDIVLQYDIWETLYYFFKGITFKESVLAYLESVSAGEEWFSLFRRIDTLDYNDRDEVESLQQHLVELKPIVTSGIIDDNNEAPLDVDPALFDNLDNSEAVELTQEQKALAEHINQFLDNVMLEEYGIYYIRCRVSFLLLFSWYLLILQ